MVLDVSDKNKMQEKIEKAKCATACLVEGISSLNASLAAFRKRCFRTMSEIRSAADLLVNEIRLNEEKLIAKVQNISDLKEQYVQQQKKNLEENISELQQSIDYTTDILNSYSLKDFNLDEWKNAIVSQLDDLSTLQLDHGMENNMDDDGKFLFAYANEELLKSVANYGAIVSEVPHEFKFSQQDDADIDACYGENLKVNVIPILTLNGAVFDVDAAINDDDDDVEVSSDDESDFNDDSDSHGDDEHSDDYKYSDDDDDDDNDNENNDDDSNDSSEHDNDVGGDDDGIDVDRHIANKSLTKTKT